MIFLVNATRQFKPHPDWGIGTRKSYWGGCASQAKGEIQP